MIGPVITVIAIVIAVPVAVLMSGAVASLIMGYFLRDDAEARYEGSELIDLNR